mmetsp:Transcript_107293/g.185975  ORF Transcript_107293/g.185975 Transcript_107293/m.185975 type:complete len:139 (-) Transcript_107293:133-549(-)
MREEQQYLEDCEYIEEKVNPSCEPFVTACLKQFPKNPVDWGIKWLREELQMPVRDDLKGIEPMDEYMRKEFMKKPVFTRAELIEAYQSERLHSLMESLVTKLMNEKPKQVYPLMLECLETMKGESVPIVPVLTETSLM